jgi:hypothetical protein
VRADSAHIPPGDSAARSARDALRSAAGQAAELASFLNARKTRKSYPELWDELCAAVSYVVDAIDIAWRRRFTDASPVAAAVDSRTIPTTTKVTLLARYEHACELVARAAIGDRSAERYAEALSELEMAMADHSIKEWAPADPTMAELHDIDQVTQILAGQRTDPGALAAYRLVRRFKDLIGSPAPVDFPALATFAAHHDALTRCGIYTAARFSAMLPAQIVLELGASAGEAARLLEIARLYGLLRDASAVSGQVAITGDADKRAAAMTFLLLEAQLDRLADLRDALASPAELKERLIGSARGWAVAAPGEQELLGWRRELQTSDYLARMRAGWFAVCRDRIPAPARPWR